MKEKIIRILRIILFDAFKSRWAWRRVPTQWYFKYMISKRKPNIINTKLPPEYEMIYKKSANPFYKDTLVICFSQGGFWGATYFKCNFISLKYNLQLTKEYSSKNKWGHFNFIPQFDELTNYLVERILEFNYTRVIIFGGSATGRPAMLYSQILSGKCPFTQFYNIACAPATDASKNDYSGFYNNQDMENLKKYGSFDVLNHKLQLPRENLFVYIIVGKFSKGDCERAQSLSACKYLKIFDDIETERHHVTMMMFLNNKLEADRKRLYNLLALQKGANKVDEDNDKAVQAMEKIFHKDGKALQELNLLIDELITTGKITALYK